VSVEKLLEKDYFQDLFLNMPGGKEYIRTLFTSNPLADNAPKEVKEAEEWLLKNRSNNVSKELDILEEESRK
jgi:hypothetical protein